MLATIVNALKQVVSPDYDFNRRRLRRIRKRLPLQIQPLDADFNAAGDPFWTTSRDFSRNGIGFNWHETLECPYVHITIPDHSFNGIAEVRHFARLSIDNGMYIIGAEFLDEFEAGLTSEDHFS